MTVSKRLRNELAELDKHRCAYCLSADFLTGQRLTIDHIRPIAAGGTDALTNLCLACRSCNEFKGARFEAIDVVSAETIPLFNPRTQTWSDHFAWSEDGASSEAKSATGRVTVKLLNMNNDLIVKVRKRWVLAGWHPPDD